MKDKYLAKKIISKDNLEIYYWVTWNKELSKRFVVLHPASSMNHSSLQNLEQRLNEIGFPTLVLDPRGSGFSEAPPEPEYFTLDKYSDDLRKIIEEEGLEKPSYLGHSFGFMPIVDYVSKSPNAYSITGICASYNFSKTAHNRLLFNLFNTILRYAEYVGSFGMKLYNLTTRKKNDYPDQYGLEGKTDLNVWFSIVNTKFREIKTHIISGIEINKWDVTEQIKKIKVPILLIYGNKDIMVKPDTGEYISSLTKGYCEIEIIEGTHSLPITKPLMVLEVIKGHKKHFF